MRFKGLLCAGVLLAVLCSVAFAGYWDNVSHKADRGFSNALGCWLELPYQTYAISKEKGIMMSPLGVGKGIVMVPLRLLSGAADLLTFPMACPLTGWNGMVRPEYNPWVEEPEKPAAETAAPEQAAQK